MKRLLAIALMLLSISVKSQDVIVLNTDSFNRYPYYLSNGWKFIAGDSPVCASKEFDDSKAVSINPALNQTDLGSKVFKGIGWFRLHFTIDTSLTGKPLALALTTTGATEVYVDGKFLKSYGEISTNGNSIYYDPQEIPFVFFINDTGAHLLAIRYANFNASRNSKVYHYQNAGFKIMIGKADRLIYQKDLRSTVFAFTLMLLSGIFLALSLLHLFMFLYHRIDRSNLSFSIFMFCIGAAFIISFIGYAIHNPEVQLKGRLMLIPVLCVACLALSGFINELFAKKKGLRFWAIVALGIITMLLGLFGMDFYPVIAISLVITVSIEAIITILIAMIKKVKGAKIIGTGILFLTLFILTVFTLAIARGEDIELNDGTPEGQLLLLFLGLAILSTPVSMSVYQAWRFARVNKDLALQLQNVKLLSQKSIEQEQEKQRMLESRKEDLEKEIKLRTDELKESQQQLVHQEKLASLGALTAGIAHEIKNPLNFVNNFAQLSNELLEELKEAKTEEEKNEIMQLLQDNLSKINQHGNRADSIVKSMLEHSRSGSGERQLTDINSLCDEFLNLAYHGMRATVKDFNCSIEKHFSPGLQKVNIVQQDISRVILNIINNAFYAIKDKSDGKLSITTRFDKNKVQISIKDNGTGMPESVKQKIFEPFFTTKPAGMGTGLGMSLSYDIIKAHNGRIEVLSEEGEGTEFVISLPLES